MAQGAKVLITDDARFDLEAYRWDDHRFSDILIRENPIDPDQAMHISRFIRQEIAKMDLQTITLPMIEKLIESKLLEYGLDKLHPVRLDKSIFVRNGMLLSDNARQVLERRYLKKDTEGSVIEPPEEMFRRVSRHIAKAEKLYDKQADVQEYEERFYKLMTDARFLPNSPTLMNAGRSLGQLAACFVLPVADSMDGIFDSLKNAALIHKSGGKYESEYEGRAQQDQILPAGHDGDEQEPHRDVGDRGDGTVEPGVGRGDDVAERCAPGPSRCRRRPSTRWPPLGIRSTSRRWWGSNRSCTVS